MDTRAKFTERRGQLKDLDRSFDLAFWQAQSSQARFSAAWELIVHASRIRGMMFVNSDFTDLLRLFNDNNVKYLVIGGYAFIQSAEPRYTKDLDLWISTD